MNHRQETSPGCGTGVLLENENEPSATALQEELPGVPWGMGDSSASAGTPAQEHPPTPSFCWTMLNLKPLTNKPHKHLWDQLDFFFLRAVILEKAEVSHKLMAYASTYNIYINKRVTFLKPWWTATVFRYQSSQLNTLQQGTVAKTPISPSSTACTGQWFISIGSVIFRTQLTPAKRTKEFWETWFSGTFHFLSAFPPSLGIHPNLVPQTGFQEEASLSPADCNFGCFRTKLRASTLQLLYQIYVLLQTNAM